MKKLHTNCLQYIPNEVYTFHHVCKLSDISKSSNQWRTESTCNILICFVFASNTTFSDWCRKLGPLSQPNRRKTKTNLWFAHTRFAKYWVSYLYLLCVLISSISRLSVSFVISQTDCFGFGFTTLAKLPLTQKIITDPWIICRAIKTVWFDFYMLIAVNQEIPSE